MASAVAPIHRLTVDDVRRMEEAGVLGELDRVELVEGVLVDMMPIGPQHDGAVAYLTRHFARPDAAYEVRVQSLMHIPGGFLLPDLMVIAPLAAPRAEQPSTALLVVEVAQTSQRRDEEKGADYARAGVADYWIVDLEARAVHLHRKPRDTSYADVRVLRDGDVLTPLIDAAPVDVTTLLG